MAKNTCGKAAILETFQAAKSFQRFPLHFKKIAKFSIKALKTFSEMHIFCMMQNIDFKQQLVGGALKVLGKSLKAVFNEVHFLVN